MEKERRERIERISNALETKSLLKTDARYFLEASALDGIVALVIGKYLPIDILKYIGVLFFGLRGAQNLIGLSKTCLGIKAWNEYLKLPDNTINYTCKY